MRRLRLPRGLKLTEVLLAGILGVISGLYTFKPLIIEYKAYEEKILEERKKLIESEEKDSKADEAHKVGGEAKR